MILDNQGDVKQTVTEGFDKMQKKLDANRKAVQEQLTQRFNKVDQHLVKVQGLQETSCLGLLLLRTLTSKLRWPCQDNSTWH